MAVLVTMLAHGWGAWEVADDWQATLKHLRHVHVPRVLDLGQRRLHDLVARDGHVRAPLRIELIHLADARGVGRLVLWHLGDDVRDRLGREEVVREPNIGRPRQTRATNRGARARQIGRSRRGREERR
jgi:hypothetical protein